MSMNVNRNSQPSPLARLASAAAPAGSDATAPADKPAAKPAEPTGGGAPSAGDPLRSLAVPDLDAITVPEPELHANNGGKGTGSGGSGTRGPRGAA